MSIPATPSPSSVLHEHETMRRPLRISIESPLSDPSKQFDSPTGVCGSIVVPTLDYSYCSEHEGAPSVDESEYNKLRKLVAPDSEAGSPRPRRQIRQLAERQDDNEIKFSEALVSSLLFRRSDSDEGRKMGSVATAVDYVQGVCHVTLSDLPQKILFEILGFLSGQDLTKMGLVCKSFAFIARTHPSWQRNVLMEYGFKYDNYSLYTGNTDWYQIYGKVSSFIRRLRKGQPRKQLLDRVLEPIAIPNYEGSMALTMDTNIFLWENGEIIQAVDLRAGKEIFRVPVLEERTSTSRPCIISTKLNIFYHINGRIHVFSIDTGEKIRELFIAEKDPWRTAEFCLDLSIRNNQLTFLTTRTLHVWDSVTLDYLYKIEHSEPGYRFPNTGELDFLWCGFSLDGQRSNSTGSSTTEVYLSQHRRSRHIATWMKMESPNIALHNLEDASLCANLIGTDGPLARVRHVQNTNDISNYYISSLSVTGTVCIWDSSVPGFACISKLHTNNPRAFRFAMTTTQMFMMSDDEPSACNNVNMWCFSQPSKREVEKYLERRDVDDKISLDFGGMKIEGMKLFNSMKSCRLSRNVYFSDIIDNRFLGLWYSIFREGTTMISLSQSNWEVYDSLQRPPDQSPMNSGFGGIRHSSRSRSVCEMSQPMAFRQPETQQSRRGSCYGGLSIDCGDGAEVSSSSNNVVGQEEDSLLSRRCFRMLHRADTWSMLDWKSLSVLTDGSLMVYDFAASP